MNLEVVTIQRFEWKVTHQTERRWFKWRIHSTYTLRNPPDGGSSFSYFVDSANHYWRRHSALRELRVLEAKAKFGEPKLMYEALPVLPLERSS